MAKLLIRVPAVNIDAVNAGLYSFRPALGERCITAEFSSDGNAPVSDFICCVYVTLADKNAIETYLQSNFAGKFDLILTSIDAALGQIASTWNLQPVAEY